MATITFKSKICTRCNSCKFCYRFCNCAKYRQHRHFRQHDSWYLHGCRSTTNRNGSLTQRLASTVKGTVSVTATASDDLGVTQVEFLVDGSSKSTVTTASLRIFFRHYDAQSDGTHTISAKAYDANNTTTATVSVTVDNNAPTVSISAPVSGTLVRGNCECKQRTASDTVGVTKVEFYVDGVLKSHRYILSICLFLGYNGSGCWFYSLLAKAYDNAGNVG